MAGSDYCSYGQESACDSTIHNLAARMLFTERHIPAGHTIGKPRRKQKPSGNDCYRSTLKNVRVVHKVQLRVVGRVGMWLYVMRGRASSDQPNKDGNRHHT